MPSSRNATNFREPMHKYFYSEYRHRGVSILSSATNAAIVVAATTIKLNPKSKEMKQLPQFRSTPAHQPNKYPKKLVIFFIFSLAAGDQLYLCVNNQWLATLSTVILLFLHFQMVPNYRHSKNAFISYSFLQLLVNFDLITYRTHDLYKLDSPRFHIRALCAGCPNLFAVAVT